MNPKLKTILLTGFFFSGLLLGILFVDLWGDTYLGGSKFLENEMLPTIRQTTFDARSLFFYLCKDRTAGFLLFWLLGYTAFGWITQLLLFAWIGFAGGAFMSLFVVNMGLAGVLIFLAMLLPQWIFYAVSLWVMAGAVFARGLDRKVMDPWGKIRGKEKQYVKTILLSGAFLVLGMVLESTVNPFLLKFAINYFC